VWGVLVKAHKGLAALVAGESIAGWEPPLSFSDVTLPPFPLDIFPPWLRSFAEAVTETMQTPPDLAGMLSLSVLSAACARYVAVEAREGWIEPVNVYTVTALPPGSRKSPVFRAMMAPLLAWEQQQCGDARVTIAEHQAAKDVLEQRLETAKRKAAAKNKSDDEAMADVNDLARQLAEHRIPAMPKLIVDDVTPEPLASFLAEQGGRLAVLSSEGDVFSIMAGRYSSGMPNIGVYLRGHSGDTLRVDRRNRADHIDWPALTVGITTQPEVLREFGRNGAFKNQGLLARFFYALPHSTVGERDVNAPPIPQAIQQTYEATMRMLLAYAPTMPSSHSVNTVNYAGNVNTGNKALIALFKIIKLKTPSKAILTEWLEWLEPQLGKLGAFAAMVDWASKLGGGIVRIAGLLHMASGICRGTQWCHEDIAPQTMIDAIRLAQYLIPHAYAAYAEVGADPLVQQARRIIEWLEQSQVATFAKRDAHRALSYFKRAADLDEPLELLVDREYIRPVEIEVHTGPGRKPSQRYEVNPYVTRGTVRNAIVSLPVFKMADTIDTTDAIQA
jgi:replicative DNA helicase